MNWFKFKKILYFLTVTIVLLLGIFAIYSNLTNSINRNNILKYETVIFKTNWQLKETVGKSYDIDTNFDFIAEVRKINNLSENEGMLGKALLIPILISN